MDAAPAEAAERNGWLVCQEVREALKGLGERLEQAIDLDEPLLRQAALALIRRGGKRLRPALVLAAARFGDFEEPRLLGAAAAIELLHIASLYHDDVIDRAPSRRGQASVNAHWGNTLAALAGTYLFARASALLASLGETPNRLASQACADLCTGQLQEVENAYNLDLMEAEHLEILARKTATLFELPCRLGAHLAALTSTHAKALAIYGRRLGLAFQLADDALDVAGRPGRMGKATGTDLRQGIYSLPVLRALRRAGTGERLRALLEQVRLSEEDLREAQRLVRASGAVAETLAAARRQAQLAQAALEPLPEGAARLSLHNLARFAAARSR